MAKLFSVASWNVKHFNGEGADSPRVGRVIDFLADQKPSLFAIYEVKGSTVFRELVDRMSDYSFQITEGPQTQEILVGFRRNMQAFVTQKTTFKAGTTHMRPGQLVTVTIGDDIYSILFLHVASGTNPRGMGLRDEMVQRALKFRKVLDRAAGGRGKANYIFAGDLNSMGLDYRFDKDIDAATELRNWDHQARFVSHQMKRLRNSHPHSWSNAKDDRYPDSLLDHVYAADHLNFKSFGQADGEPAHVDVRGWVNAETEAKKRKWVRDYSDHALLYFEVHD